MQRALLMLAAALVLTVASSDQVRAVPAGQSCGGFVGGVCDKRLWCDPAPGACYFPLVGGVCVKTPRFCAQIYQPVCGCDGKTYGNDCERRARRVPKLSDGKCW